LIVVKLVQEEAIDDTVAVPCIALYFKSKFDRFFVYIPDEISCTI